MLLEIRSSAETIHVTKFQPCFTLLFNHDVILSLMCISISVSSCQFSIKSFNHLSIVGICLDTLFYYLSRLSYLGLESVSRFIMIYVRRSIMSRLSISFSLLFYLRSQFIPISFSCHFLISVRSRYFDYLVLFFVSKFSSLVLSFVFIFLSSSHSSIQLCLHLILLFLSSVSSSMNSRSSVLAVLVSF